MPGLRPALERADNYGQEVWQQIPGEFRSTFRRLIVTQGDTEPASVEQQRLLAQTRAYLEELAKLNHLAMEHPWDTEVRQQLEQVCLKLNLKELAEMWRRAAQTSAGATSPKLPSPPNQD